MRKHNWIWKLICNSHGRQAFFILSSFFYLSLHKRTETSAFSTTNAAQGEKDQKSKRKGKSEVSMVY